MHGRDMARGLAAVGVLGIGAGGLVLGGAAAPASAFTGTCPTTVPAATLVADGVCEVRMTASGSFTPPAGIAKLSAVLVGAGGGAAYTTDGFYAGDGGSVTYIDSVSLAGPIPVVVGVGGQPGPDPAQPATDGGETSVGTVPAAGGLRGGFAQPFCIDPDRFYGFGDGARTDSAGIPDCLPGLGFGLVDLPNTDPALFPASAAGVDVYGNGGDATDAADLIVASPVAGTGGSINTAAAVAGSNGLVIFRFQAPAVAPAVITPAAPELAATGADVTWATPALALAAILGGALLMRRGRTQARP